MDKIPEVDEGSDSVFVVDPFCKVTTLTLTAIPVEMKQGEEQPSSAASPLHTLPTVSCHYYYIIQLKACIEVNTFIYPVKCSRAEIFLWMADFIGRARL